MNRSSLRIIVCAMLPVALFSLSALATGSRTVLRRDAPTIDDLAWMTGGWAARRGQATIEEHWIHPAGGTMFGVNRTVAGERTVAFEYLRIEERPDGVVYVAQPGGGAVTDFVLTFVDDGEAVFENPEHDFPQLIRYERGKDGSLTATIEGAEGGEQRSMEFAFRPLEKD